MQQANHFAIQHVHDSGVHARVHGKHEKRMVDDRTRGQTEGDIGKPADHMRALRTRADLLCAGGKRGERLRIRRERMYDGIDQQPVFRDAIFGCFCANLLKKIEPTLRVFRHAGVGARQRDYLPIGIRDQWKNGFDLAALHGDGVDDACAFALRQHGG